MTDSIKRSLIIVGAGGLGREVVDIVQTLPKGGWREVAFVDDAVPAGKTVHGVRVLGDRTLLSGMSPDEVEVCIAVGDPVVRKTLVADIASRGLSFATLIDSTALVRPTVSLGCGVIIGACTFLSCDASIGDHAVVNPGALIGHDVVIGSYAVIGGGAALSGGSRVGEGSLIGASAALLHNTVVGDWCTVAMGARVFAAVMDGQTVLGNPARPLPGAKKVVSPDPRSSSHTDGSS